MSHGAKARLFVALDLPAAVRERLALWARETIAGLRLEGDGATRPLRVLDRDALHLTVCFLGSRPIAEIPAIGQTVNECPAELGDLSVGAPLWLPSKRPRALAIAVHDDDGELSRLHGALIRAISEATGWQPERRRFRAHITLVRTRGREPRGADPLVASSLAFPTPPLRFSAESLSLYRSRLEPGGASYEALTSRELGPLGA